MKRSLVRRMLGVAAAAFGAGILLAFFLSPRVLAVIEAAAVIAVGLLFADDS